MAYAAEAQVIVLNKSLVVGGKRLFRITLWSSKQYQTKNGTIFRLTMNLFPWCWI